MNESAPRSASGRAGASTLLIRFHRYRALLRRRWWILFLTSSIGICSAAWISHKSPPSFESSARMMVSGQIRLQEGSIYSEEAMNFYGTQVELMQSGHVRQRAAARVQALKPELRPAPVALKVMQPLRTSIFILRAYGADAAYTRSFLDAVLEEYLSLKTEMRSQTSDRTLSAITEELLRLEKELRAGEEELLTLQKKDNVVFLQEAGNSAGTYLAKLNNQLSDLRIEYQLLDILDLDQNIERLNNGLVSSPVPEPAPGKPTEQKPSLKGMAGAADYLKTRQALILLKAEREDTSRFLRPNHPNIAKLTEEIKLQESLIAIFREENREQLAVKHEAVRLQIENLQKVVAEWEVKALDLSRKIGEFNKIHSKVERAKSLYDKLLTSVRGIDVSNSIGENTVSIMEKASVPISTKATSKTLSSGFAVGFAAGLALLLLLNRLDDRVRSLVEVQDHFDEALLGEVPREKPPKARAPLELLEHDDRRHVFSEAFRSLRSSLLFMPFQGERLGTILLTSAVPSEGKSTVSANLAITMASAGSRTLLVDGDLRRGILHKLLQLPPDPGFAEVLQQEVRWSEVVRPTSIENLSFLASGKPPKQPSRLFLKKFADQFLKEVAEEYEYVVIDSAPVLAADDTSSFAPKVDAAIFVMRLGFTSVRLAQRALTLLYNRQVKVLGIVANGAETSLPEHYYYHYSGHPNADTLKR